MASRSNVSPVPLSILEREQGIAIQYLDGRVVEYETPIEARQERISASTAYNVHVVVTDLDLTEGIIVYVNDYDTSDAILESTGVGRVLLEVDKSASLYPGVSASRGEEQITISVDPAAIGGAVFAFVENQLDERAYRLV